MFFLNFDVHSFLFQKLVYYMYMSLGLTEKKIQKPPPLSLSLSYFLAKMGIYQSQTISMPPFLSIGQRLKVIRDILQYLHG